MPNFWKNLVGMFTRKPNVKQDRYSPTRSAPATESWRRLWLYPSLILVFIALALGLRSRHSYTYIANPQIGLVDIKSEIISSQKAIEFLDELAKDESVKGVILSIDSPGGATVPSHEIYEAVLRLKELKPVYVSMGSIAASGAYMISVAANKIYADPMSITGSVGVILFAYTAQDLLNKIGIQPLVFKSGAMKDALSPFRKPTQAETDLIQKLIDETYHQFVDLVKLNRPNLIGKTEDLFDGRVFSANQAKENGMIDALGDFHVVLEAMKKDLQIPNAETYKPESLKYQLTEFLQNTSFFGKITTFFGTEAGLGGLQSIYRPGLLR